MTTPTATIQEASGLSPQKDLHVVLVTPEIAWNTGNAYTISSAVTAAMSAAAASCSAGLQVV